MSSTAGSLDISAITRRQAPGNEINTNTIMLTSRTVEHERFQTVS